MFDTVLGLPVHALVVHAVVVLVPLCGVAVVVMAISTRWRERLMIPLLVLLTLAAGATFVAKESGEQLKDRLTGVTNPDLTRHVDLGDKAFYIVGAFWLVVVVWAVLDRRRTRDREGGGLLTAFTALAVVAAIGATTWIVLTGHAGSGAVWRQTVESTNNR